MKKEKLDSKYREIKRCIKGVNDLETWCKENPGIGDVILKEYDEETNPPITSVKPGSNLKVNWICSKCGKRYSTKIYYKRNGCMHRDCNMQTIINNMYEKRLELNKNYLLSESDPELLKYWDYEKNELIGLRPDRIMITSNKKAYWKCPYCGKEVYRAIKWFIYKGMKCDCNKHNNDDTHNG